MKPAFCPSRKITAGLETTHLKPLFPLSFPLPLLTFFRRRVPGPLSHPGEGDEAGFTRSLLPVVEGGARGGGGAPVGGGLGGGGDAATNAGERDQAEIKKIFL